MISFGFHRNEHGQYFCTLPEELVRSPGAVDLTYTNFPRHTERLYQYFYDSEGEQSSVHFRERLVVDENCGQEDKIVGYIERNGEQYQGEIQGSLYEKTPLPEYRQYDDKTPALGVGENPYASAGCDQNNAPSYYTEHGTCPVAAFAVNGNGTVIVPLVYVQKVINFKGGPRRLQDGKRPKRIS